MDIRRLTVALAAAGLVWTTLAAPVVPSATADGGHLAASSMVAPGVKQWRARVVRVVDGDTIKVRLRSGQRVRVRLLGIDTPEVFEAPECWGTEASEAAKDLLPRHTRVKLTSDPTQALKDEYGRLLRYVSMGHVDVNRRLVRRGHAEVYVYDEPFQRVKSYRKAQRHAKSNGLGLWGNCTTPAPVPPPPPPADDMNSYPPISTYDCPSNAPIKGNESSMIYHPPDSPWYAQTTPEQCFASEAGAVAHGFRRAIY
jgi:endonuclease YncB( thermonuclease family)